MGLNSIHFKFTNWDIDHTSVGGQYSSLKARAILDSAPSTSLTPPLFCCMIVVWTRSGPLVWNSCSHTRPGFQYSPNPYCTRPWCPPLPALQHPPPSLKKPLSVPHLPLLFFLLSMPFRPTLPLCLSLFFLHCQSECLLLQEAHDGT